MDIDIIRNHVQNPILQQVVLNLDGIVDRVKEGTITFQQGSIEITGQKHIIQSVALNLAEQAFFTKAPRMIKGTKKK